jgi:murein endopeptidase
LPGRRAAALLAALALAGAGCGEAEPVEQVRVLQLSPATVLPAAGGGSSAVGVQATVAKAPAVAATATEAAAYPVVQVPDVGSIAVDATNGGRLVNGLQLPAQGLYWVTWDGVLGRIPNRADRRWGSDRLISFIVTVLRDYRIAHPTAPRVLVGDLSRPFGGPFGSDFGGLGHRSHQNGLDVDVYYPRADHTLRAPSGPQDVDRALAQDLVSRFVAYGAQFAFVGPHVGLGGPPAIVQALAHHDDHVHIRIANATSGARSETARR